MRTAVSYKLCLWLIILLSLSAFEVNAGDFAAVIKGVQMDVRDDSYVLSAEISYKLSEQVKEALQSGVPLFWNIQIKVHRPRHILWQKTLAEETLRYRLQYHALLNMYRVRNETSGEIYNFSTLPAALDLMSNLHDVRLVDWVGLAQEKQLLVELKVEFDRSALPLPLRTIAYLNRQWYLSSYWTVWPWKK
ncbi:MAG: DUF4390 domain-containing protein [Methylovulum sp.]|nr:DUF4390 domain-containing protein [Methylovulum sp.]